MHKVEEMAHNLESLRDLLLLSTMSALKSGSHTSGKGIEEKLDKIQSDLHTRAQDLENILRRSPYLDTTMLSLTNVFRQGTLSVTLEDKQEKEVRRQKAILQMLYYRQMRDRSEEIPDACKSTFEWVFCKPVHEQPWDSLLSYLSSSDVYRAPAYWINGKAGSGKSVLLKFISDDPRTEEALLKWAKPMPLLKESFYFWSLGVTLQKSYSGLIRCLMHSILDKNRSYIELVFPELKNSDGGPELGERLSLAELRRAFSMLIHELTKKKMVCLFIDGVDEFAGNHKDLASFLLSLASPQLKLVISGRPIPACINAFKDCLSLRLQDLTKSDIITYVEQNFSKRVAFLSQGKPNDIVKLAESIEKHACGVFLWVRLVVDILVAGADNGDDIYDLRQKLNVLPKNLERLYAKIFKEMDPLCRAQASEAFQLMRQWRLKCTDQPMQTLNFSFCEKRPAYVSSNLQQSLTAEEARDRCRLVQKRLESRCGGLLEVHEKSYDTVPFFTTASGIQTLNGQDQSIIRSNVQYMHRTVEEFLSQRCIWETVCSYRKKGEFDPLGQLAVASISMLMMEPPETAMLRMDCYQHQRNFFVFLGAMSRNDQRLIMELLEAFHNLLEQMGFDWKTQLGIPILDQLDLASHKNQIKEQSSIVAYAVQAQLD